MKKETNVGITVKKEDDFSEWYTQVILKSGLADYSAVSGCIVFRPLAYAIWERVMKLTDERIKKIGVENAYFPMFIPESLLAKEEAHVKGFTPEVAWVTEGGHTKLGERLAVRPTSEAIMYDSYSKWIRSWRDLPLRLNQWNSVVRWEFKHPVPFLRTREFLWNEGHTAFATKEEADKEIGQILGIWKDIVFNYMALYGVIGKKSDKEKFAGAIATYAMELIMPNGRIIQGPDAHSDGQNFAKAYNIKFVDRDEKEKHVWQNTWAITTRMIGVMAAIHSDDKGLVLPPMIAPTKIVIVPIYKEDTRKDVVKEAKKIAKKLQPFGACLDDRDEYSPGWKFNEWELKGVPLRIEIGPRDIENKSVTAVRRDNGKKEAIPVENLPKRADEILKDIQNGLFARSKAQFESRVSRAKNMEEFTKSIEEKNIVLADFCGEEKCEDAIKDKSGGASSAVTVEESNGACFNCGKKAKHVFYFGKGY
ncbi:MAG TPA: proline--tRNA ligase [Candidatus Nanoarchaeia archaeon]|nr:proline--tRNA ligase [Candidatus Nanoarchaeia archaeon]